VFGAQGLLGGHGVSVNGAPGLHSANSRARFASETLILRGNELDMERGFPSSWAHGFPKLSHLDLSAMLVRPW